MAASGGGIGVVLTAAAVWILQVYPALTRRRRRRGQPDLRVLAPQLASLRRACREGSGLAIDDIPTDVAVGVAQVPGEADLPRHRLRV